jgi:hypothetical protein
VWLFGCAPKAIHSDPGEGGATGNDRGGSTGSGGRGGGSQPSGGAGGQSPGSGGSTPGSGGGGAQTDASGPAKGGATGSDAGGTQPPPGDGGVPQGTDPYGTLPSGGGNKMSPMAFEDRLYNYEITVAPVELAKLNMNPAMYDDLGLYVPATVKIDGQDLGMVGLRYKGSWGNFRTCLPNGGTGPAEPYMPPAGNGCPPFPKFPYKIAFDQYDINKKYAGLKKINLHSLIRDPSKLHERLAYQLFRDMGIATARSTHAKVTVNGVYKGLYAVTEAMTDGRFTSDRWPTDPEGNMYKQAWPIWLFVDYYKTKLETNTDPVPPPAIYDKILAFAKDVYNAKTNDQAWAAVMKWSDPDWLGRYLAVDTVTRNADGVTKFLCNPNNLQNDCQNNNFFFYQTKGDKFLLLPWDLDYTWNVKADHDPIPPWDKPIADCTMRFNVYGGMHKAPSCDPIFKAMNTPMGRPFYIDAIKKMLAGPYNVQKMQADVDRWAGQIREAVMMDKDIDAAAWQTQLTVMKNAINTLRGMIQGVVDGKDFRPWPPPM